MRVVGRHTGGILKIVSMLQWHESSPRRRIVSMQWNAGNLQHRPRHAAHRPRAQRPADQHEHQDRHGWQGRLARQRPRRAPLEVGQMRGGLPAHLRQRVGGSTLDRPTSRLLQRPATSFEPGQQTPDRACFNALRSIPTNGHNQDRTHLPRARNCSDKLSQLLVAPSWAASQAHEDVGDLLQNAVTYKFATATA